MKLRGVTWGTAGEDEFARETPARLGLTENLVDTDIRVWCGESGYEVLFTEWTGTRTPLRAEEGVVVVG